jgi:hypothetical protein
MGTQRATISGRVVDANGAALAGATILVRASGERTVSDSDGAFLLDVPASTTLTVATTAAHMAPTLLPQFILAPDGDASFTIPMVASDRLAGLVAMGPNPMGGAVAVNVKSVAGAHGTAGDTTIALTPINLGRVLYAPESHGLPDPDPALTAIGPGDDCLAWALGVQPHVSIMELSLRGTAQLQPPYSIDDVIYPGTFTVDAGSLTLVTLFTP